MRGLELEIDAVEEARRRAAAKVRSLLEQLEAAEREFEALTEKAKMLSGSIPPGQTRPSITTSA